MNLIFFLFSFYVIQAQTILCLGDSLTEGYQLKKEEAYPYLLEQSLKKDFPQIKVINAGVSGATSASGLKRLSWYLSAKPDVMFLALGANDGLRGLKVEETYKNLSAIIKEAQNKKIKVVLAGMYVPTNYGKKYADDFRNNYTRLVKEFHLPFLPFLLEGVAGNPELNLSDGIHPNPKGHLIMTKNILKVLRSSL